MKNRNLIDLYMVLGKITDTDLLYTNKNIEVIKDSDIDISEILKFIFDMPLDSSELNRIIDILGMAITNIKDKNERIRILNILSKRIKTWYICLETYTFEGVIYDLETCIKNYERHSNEIDEYINLISIIDTLQQESFYLNSKLYEVRGFCTNEHGQRGFSFQTYAKADNYISMIIVKDEKVTWYKAKNIKTLHDKKVLLKQVINNGYELMILSSSGEEEDKMRSKILEEAKIK